MSQIMCKSLPSPSSLPKVPDIACHDVIEVSFIYISCVRQMTFTRIPSSITTWPAMQAYFSTHMLSMCCAGCSAATLNFLEEDGGEE